MTSRRQRISVVIISRNEGQDLRNTVENLEDTLPDNAEIVVVDDGSTDRSAAFLVKRPRKRVRLLHGHAIGVSKARVMGAKKARGNVLIFSDAHMGMDPGWWKPLLDQVADPKVGAAAPGMMRLPASGKIGYGITFKGPSMDVRWLQRKPAGPVDVPILPGACFVMRRDVFESTGGGWDLGLLQRGNIDNEVCVSLWLQGFDLRVVPEVVVRHKFRDRSPYPVGWPQYLHNRLRLAFVHFGPARLGRVVSRLRTLPGFGEALGLLVDGDITARRRLMAQKHVRSDDWLFERFNIRW